MLVVLIYLRHYFAVALLDLTVWSVVRATGLIHVLLKKPTRQLYQRKIHLHIFDRDPSWR